MREDDVNRIVETNRNRTTEDKFSYVATLAEIAENDYNLNIPRYVDTFEEEAAIDLQAVATKLEAVDKDLQATNATIAQFCKELNISTPF